MKKIVFVFAVLWIVLFSCNNKGGQSEANVANAYHKAGWDTIYRGKEIHLFTMANESGMEVRITNYGAKVVSLRVPDKNGEFRDIVLGYDNIRETLSPPGNPYFGAVIGRYANRIARGKFTIDNVKYSLNLNSGPNALHGGREGYQNMVFDAVQDDNKLILTLVDTNMHEGYPGNVKLRVMYELTGDNELKISYDAVTDKATVINLTSHSFFNLKGAGEGSIEDHLLMINADRYTPIDSTSIPTGELATVKGTPFDFTTPKLIRKDIETDDDQLKTGSGYDHNYVLNGRSGEMKFAARLVESESGIIMEVFTSEPGLQLYTGNHLNGSIKGKGGRVYAYRSALCLETQHFPDSPNHNKFPSTLLRPGEKFHSETIYHFDVAK